jgi:integrase
MEALPCDFHSFIVSMKKSLDKLQADNGSLNMLEPEKRIKEAMHPHALRHTFCNIMWYRTYTGKRNDLRELMLTMGHGNFEITQGYLDRYCAVNTDAEWFKLMQGNPLIDYKHAMSQDSFALKKVIHSPSKTFLRRRDAEI